MEREREGQRQRDRDRETSTSVSRALLACSCSSPLGTRQRDRETNYKNPLQSVVLYLLVPVAVHWERDRETEKQIIKIHFSQSCFTCLFL